MGGSPAGGGYQVPPPGGGFAPPGGGYSAPAPGGGFGPPGAGDPMMGGGGGGGYGQPQGGYGQPAQGGYGQPPQAGAYGAPPGAMAAPGQFGAGPMGAPGYGGGAMQQGGAKGQIRNPVTVVLTSMLCCVYGLIQMWQMMNELQQYTRDEEFKPFYMFIPLLNYYFLWIKVPEQVTRAKQMAGSRNPQAQSIVLYIFLAPYALAKDLNEIWDPMAPS
jgi:hypothetical protein